AAFAADRARHARERGRKRMASPFAEEMMAERQQMRDFIDIQRFGHVRRQADERMGVHPGPPPEKKETPVEKALKIGDEILKEVKKFVPSLKTAGVSPGDLGVYSGQETA